MPANRLIDEKSPYLLQHAQNPVDWFPWGEEAFAKARREDKPIFLSIGYSTCHWCHVMERESFENDAIAELVNRHFVPIKVDREERPDVDRIYMTYVQATTGSGGWPMSVWLTPDLRPFVGGTYFPPDTRWGRPGFGAILERIAQAWRDDRAKILASASGVLEELRKQTAVEPRGDAEPDPQALESAFLALRRSFDARNGGFGGAPKFPRPVTFNFLLRYWAATRNREALEMTLATLAAMARGGMNDQLGGGFHRYSVDDHWLVPHFEKMLYDQAQLAVSYLEAFQITGDARYADTARRTLDYVLRDLRDPDGGFHSAEDADSVIDPAHPHEKGEGAFYIWSQEEMEPRLGQPAAKWFAYRYGVERDGNVREDPHEEFRGRNILFEANTVEQTAAYFEKPVEEVSASLAASAGKLLEARAIRVRPHLDDKVLTAWNGLMISAFAKGAAILGEARYLEAARDAAAFVLRHMYEPATGELLRRYRGGEAAIAGFLDDYAFFAQGLLDLYEADFDLGWLRQALALTDTMRTRFEDCVHGGFFSTDGGDSSLVMRMKEDYDGAEPSGNSIAVMNLLRLAGITNRADLRESADRALRAFEKRISAAPLTVPQMLVAFDQSRASSRQIIIAGSFHSAKPLLAELHRRFLPHRIVLLAGNDEERSQLAAWAPAIARMTPIEGRAAAYVCENYSCRLPVTEPDPFAELLQ